jgi:hypothetical protein
LILIEKKNVGLQGLHASLMTDLPKIDLFVEKASQDIKALLEPNHEEDSFPANFMIIRKLLRTTTTYVDNYRGDRSRVVTEDPDNLAEEDDNQEISNTKKFGFNKEPTLDDLVYRAPTPNNSDNQSYSKKIQISKLNQGSQRVNDSGPFSKYIKLESAGDGVINILSI